MDKCQEAQIFRHACKVFNGKKIVDEDWHYILEAGRMSPSSFGMEPWRFLVVKSQKIKEQLQPLCWNQKQISTCSHLLIIKNQIALVQDEEYIAKMFARRGLSQEATAQYIERYKSFIKPLDIDVWTAKQCYIAMESMMLAVAFRHIDSCPIEGFEREKVERFLGLDTAKERVAVIVTFGFRLNPQPAHHRLPLEELVQKL
ncbi:NAD(P)H-dependent oxidoreductase [Nitratiruptor sp. YY09-18]|uniref:NAD(P)H-dependent oxidoreductase n=1 Tax=Nitratiruptor sp. YY09-18 TaxID=2724901 RepID=UPI001915C00C|nr:NAD(P)H-dependent oxidoreductase [Nitratiruptor sp. YY09-18]BCD68922.1 hypothetical protein NitYY0918_C1845 [Nitratiruptor sp. YY09-18]